MNIIEKILKLRKSAPLKAKEPFRAFRSRLSKPYAVLFIVEKNTKNNTLIHEARRQFVVSLASAYETYWRDFIKTTINDSEIKNLYLENIRNTKFSFDELHQIMGHKLTLGELISASYTFQSTDVINCVVKNIFNIDLFASFAKAKYKMTVREVVKKRKNKKPRAFSQIIKGTDILRDRKYIDRCFEIRHETVHDTGARFKLSSKNIQKMHGVMFYFNWFLSSKLEDEIKKIN